MAIVIPAVPTNASLGSPLITPGWPMASVEKANPIADVVQAEPQSLARGTASSITHEKARTQSGHNGDRIG